MHYRWTKARWPQKGTKGAKAFIFCAFCASLWLPSSVCHPAARSVSELSRLIQLREAATAVNKKHFPSLIHHNAGAYLIFLRCSLNAFASASIRKTSMCSNGGVDASARTSSRTAALEHRPNVTDLIS